MATWLNSHKTKIYPGGIRNYHLTIVPWLWFLTLNVNSQIFQEKTSHEIIREIFQNAGFSDFTFRTNATPRKRQYCVQYNESDYHFICRLMEEDGIAFFFEHTESKHTLILSDNNSCFSAGFPKKIPLSYRNIPDENCIYEWNPHYTHTTGTWTLNDYNYNSAKLSFKT